MPKTLPEIGSKVRTAYRNNDGTIVHTDEPVEVLGPSVCGTEGRIGVRYPDGGILVIHHVDDLGDGAIGWTD